MRAAQSPSEPELILPPLRATAIVVTGLTGFILAAIFAAHLVAGVRPAAGPQAGSALPAAPQDGTHLQAPYPYTDPATIGLY